MKRALLLIVPLLLAPAPADAARCAYGKVYRPSMGVCQAKASAIRAGVYKPRYAKARLKHRVKKTRAPKLVVVETYADHVWNWAYYNRAMLIETAPEMKP